ncbi:MAG: 3-isopropylmalate dehydratase large subunit [bacterium]
MAMTITEKILAAKSGGKPIVPGDNIWVNVDALLTHDVCGPGTIGIFKQEFGKDARVWDKSKVIIIPDHYIFTRDEMSHRNVDILRAFVKEQGIEHFYDPGTPSYKGVCHVALPQEGHVRPGEVIFGTDSHTCTHGALGAFSTGVGNTDAAFIMGTGRLLIRVPETVRFIFHGELPRHVMAKDIILRIIGDIGVDGANYCAMEFSGSAISALSIEERMTICNMAIEAGAKNGVIAPDEKTIEYVKARTRLPFVPVHGDEDAHVKMVKEYDAAAMEPCVAQPHLPSNYAPAREKTGVKLDRAYVGSCTGGKITDFMAAASVLVGRKVAIETYLVPATAEVAAELKTRKIKGKTLEKIFVEAGCMEIAPPSCAACLGGPLDTYGRTKGKEVVISTTNRNFVGRMGSKEAPIYLASPLTVAASAVAGHIADPREFM